MSEESSNLVCNKCDAGKFRVRGTDGYYDDNISMILVCIGCGEEYLLIGQGDYEDGHSIEHELVYNKETRELIAEQREKRRQEENARRFPNQPLPQYTYKLKDDDSDNLET